VKASVVEVVDDVDVVLVDVLVDGSAVELVLLDVDVSVVVLVDDVLVLDVLVVTTRRVDVVDDVELLVVGVAVLLVVDVSIVVLVDDVVLLDDVVVAPASVEVVVDEVDVELVTPGSVLLVVLVVLVVEGRVVDGRLVVVVTVAGYGSGQADGAAARRAVKRPGRPSSPCRRTARSSGVSRSSARRRARPAPARRA
jgi:hypothetical protein